MIISCNILFVAGNEYNFNVIIQVTDVMLQERFYPEWARGARAWWNRGKHRIILFWMMALLATIIVVIVISTDWIRWDRINASFLATNELSRAFLASFILIMDLLIVMQVRAMFRVWVYL